MSLRNLMIEQGLGEITNKEKKSKFTKNYKGQEIMEGRDRRRPEDRRGVQKKKRFIRISLFGL